MSNEMKELENVASELGLQKISTDIYGGGQLTEEQITKATAVFNSIFNFRAPTEEGFRDDTKLVEELGKEYHLLPFGMNVDEKTMDQYLGVFDKAARPALVHCRSGFRAGMYALNHVMSRSLTEECVTNSAVVLSKEKLLDEGKKIALDLTKYDEKALEFLLSYLGSKVEQALKLGGVRQIDNDLFVGPQLTEKQLKEAKEQGIKTVVNIRDPKVEAGSLAMGVLVREEELVKNLGLQYFNFPTTAQQLPNPVEMEKILTVLRSPDTPKPILLHCRTGRRSTSVSLAYMSSVFADTYCQSFEGSATTQPVSDEKVAEPVVESN